MSPLRSACSRAPQLLQIRILKKLEVDQSLSYGFFCKLMFPVYKILSLRTFIVELTLLLMLS